MRDFKIGDVVRCVFGFTEELIEGKLYVISYAHSYNNWIGIIDEYGNDYRYFKERFILDYSFS